MNTNLHLKYFLKSSSKKKKKDFMRYEDWKKELTCNIENCCSGDKPSSWSAFRVSCQLCTSTSVKWNKSNARICHKFICKHFNMTSSTYDNCVFILAFFPICASTVVTFLTKQVQFTPKRTFEEYHVNEVCCAKIVFNSTCDIDYKNLIKHQKCFAISNSCKWTYFTLFYQHSCRNYISYQFNQRRKI